jgi:REP element-mobilizing transposase RayT
MDGIDMKIEYNNLYTHFVFSTSNRQKLIDEKNRGRIEKYITGIINNNACKLYAIYANPDHIHVLISRSPALSEEQLATIIADSSERFINQNHLCSCKFSWQQSASAFSISKSDINGVCRYILEQPLHHKKVSFAEEYEQFMHYYQKTLKIL